MPGHGPDTARTARTLKLNCRMANYNLKFNFPEA